MADKDIGGIKFTVDGDDSGLKRVDESMENLQQTAKDTEKAIDKYGNALTDADKKAGRFIDKAGKMREANGRFVKSIELAERKTGELGGTSVKTAKDIDQLKTEVKENGDQLKTAAGYATAFTAAIGTVTAIAAKAGKELNNMARLSGTSVEEFQKLAFGANEAGISTEKLGDIYKDTQDKIGDFLNTGGGELADYFENIAPKVGQTAEQFRGLSGPQALGLFQQGLEKANLTAAEQIFYLESLANDAALLSPLLADNGKGFSDAAKRMEELNLVLSQAEVDGLVEVDKAFNELGTTVAKNTQRIVGENAEEIADAIKSVSEAIASATDFISENMDMIVKITTILGSGAAAWYAYRTAILVATAAQTAFNVAARANPIGILVTVLGTAAGALLTFADNTQTAKEKVDELTGSTQALTYAEKQLLATKLEDRARIKQEELDIMNKQIEVLEAQRAAETDIQKAGRGDDDGALGAMERRAKAAKDEIKALKEKASELKVIEIISGRTDEKTAQSSKESNDELQKILDKYNKLKAEERDLLKEQEKLNAAFKRGGDNVPLIENALDKVKKRLTEIKKELGPLIPDDMQSMSIFDVGANTSDDFSDTFVTTLSPKLKKELGVQAKTFGQLFGEQLDKLDWSQYGESIGGSIGAALVTGDASGLKNALSGAAGNAAGTALTGALTASMGAGAAAFLGPIGGGIAGAVASGLLSGKEEVSRSVQVVFEDGIAQAFTNIEYDSMLGGSRSILNFSAVENERITNSFRNMARDLEREFDSIGLSVGELTGSFEGDNVADALENAAEDYVNAGFESIDMFQEFGESAVDAFTRITQSISTMQDGLRGLSNRDVTSSIDKFIQEQSEMIDAQAERGAGYWETAIVALTDLATGATEPLESAAGDLVRGTAEYERVFNEWLSRRTMGGADDFVFDTLNVTDTAERHIEYIKDNQLPEAIGRLDEGLTVATASFAETLENAVDGNLADAFRTLADVTASEAENLATQMENARDDLMELGFSENITAGEFSSLLADAQANPISADTLANFLNAAVLIDEIGEYSKALADEGLSDIRDGLDDLIKADKERLDELRESTRDQIKEEQKRSDAVIEQMQKEQDALSASISNAKSLTNLLDKAMNTLAERSEDLQKKLFAQSFSDIREAIEKAKSTGELPDAQLIEGAISQLSTAGTGEFKTRVDREREALQARKLLSDLNEVTGEQLTTDEQQVNLLDEMIFNEKANSDAMIETLNMQLDSAEENHDELVDNLNEQYDNLSEFYDDLKTVNGDQLTALEQIEVGLTSLPSALSSLLAGLSNAQQPSDGVSGGGAPSSSDVTDYLAQFTGDNFVSDEEAMQIYNQAAASGVSTGQVGDILSQLTGTAIDVNQWLDRNNLPALESANQMMSSAINNMTNTLSSQLSEIAGSSSTTANVLNSSSDPSGFGLRVSQA